MILHLVGFLLLSILVFITGGFGIYLSGSPMENKAIRYDEIRLRDFDTIKIAIESYYQDNFRLPSTVAELLVNRPKTGMPYLKKEPTDPRTKLSYTYNPLDSTQYKICAIFETSSDAINKRKTGISLESLTGSSSSLYGEDNSHPKGDYCFTKTISVYLQEQITNQQYQQYVYPTPYETPPIESTSSAL